MQVLGQKYSDAVRDQASCTPIPFPCTGREDTEAYLALADGVLLTGSPSNVHPSNFGQDVHDASLPLDPERDQITLPLIKRVIEIGMPMLAICRGLQEINVALGGTLHQAIQEIDGRNDHRGARGKPDASKEEAYAFAHPISVQPQGCLAGIIGSADVMVNSVHGQGIDRLASNLCVEATAPDGQIEAVSVKEHSGFSLALQWHPEWRAWENETSKQIFSAFGRACVEWQQKKFRLGEKRISSAA
jgi:putative glutamine amidotransferase